MKFVISILFLAFYIGAEAQFSNYSELPTAIIASAEQASQLETQLPTELIIEYDPTQLVDDVSGQISPNTDDATKKSFLIRALEKSQVTLPIKLGKAFDRLHVPADLKKFIIEDYLLPKLKNAPEALERSNATGVVGRVYGMVGVGLSDYLLNYFKSQKWGRKLPSRASFGISLGAGVAVLVFQHQGQRKIMIRLFSSFEKSATVINWMSEAMGLVSVGRVSDEILDYYENPRLFGVEKKDYTRAMLNVAGNVVTENNYFEYNFDVAAGLLFPGGFYELKGSYLGVFVVISRDTIRDLKKSLAASCRRYFRKQSGQ